MFTSVISDILKAFYQPFWFSLLLSVMFMFAYKQNKGLKQAVKRWLTWFKQEKQFRRIFFLAFYTVTVLFRTLFDRFLFENPLLNVFGEWSLYEKINNDIIINNNAVENIIMLMPFIFLLLLSFPQKFFKNKVTLLKVLRYSLTVSFLFSFTIESLQLLLHLGTFQLSDLFYNTLGGTVGGIIYYICRIIKRKCLKK